MIPGVIMALIYDTYTQHKSWDSFRYVLMSVVFGIVTYLAMQAAWSLFQLVSGIGDTKSINWRLLSVWSIPNEEKIAINPLEILLGGICAIPLGLMAVYFSTKRTFHELLLRKGISNKYGDDNAFTRSVEVMNGHTGKCYVLLHENNMLIHGKVFLYNENEKSQELGLLDATVLNSENGEVLWMTNFIYLAKEHGKMVVFENYIEASHDKEPDTKSSEPTSL